MHRLAALVVALAFVLAASSVPISRSISKDRPLRRVSDDERAKLGMPGNVCPDGTFDLWKGTYSWFCYQSYHPVSDPNAQPWCPLYGIWPLGSIGLYSATNNSMVCPPNTDHAIAPVDIVPAGPSSQLYDFCFYNITYFPQQSSFSSFCYHWNDPAEYFGLGYAFVWQG